MLLVIIILPHLRYEKTVVRSSAFYERNQIKTWKQNNSDTLHSCLLHILHFFLDNSAGISFKICVKENIILLLAFKIQTKAS